MEFNRAVTWGIFVGLVALGTIGLLAMGVMQTSTVFMMVLPSMAVFGLVMLWVGMQHGEWRARR